MSVSKLSSDLFSVILPYAGSSNLPTVRGVNKYLKDMITKHGVFPFTVRSLDELARITMLFNKHNIGKLEISLDLDRYYNKIGPAGAQAIADALKVNTGLKVLHLYCNNIGPAGAQAIADALKVNTGLKELNLYGNNIGPDGAQAIADAPKANPNIKISM